MNIIVASYVLFAAVAWVVGFTAVGLLGVAYRELGALPKPTSVFVAVLSAVTVAPAYLQVLTEPKNVFVLLRLPVVEFINGLAGLFVRWPENLAFATGVLVVALGAGRMLLPNSSSKLTPLRGAP